jgi:hypothetical protein
MIFLRRSKSYFTANQAEALAVYRSEKVVRRSGSSGGVPGLRISTICKWIGHKSKKNEAEI